ncbi:hypothetical protein SeMB42_g05707 [Synchytrium endobioticum]|nr:hypothetical protein SeMB42_g05707 [Synchytrium endobioticum]
MHVSQAPDSGIPPSGTEGEGMLVTEVELVVLSDSLLSECVYLWGPEAGAHPFDPKWRQRMSLAVIMVIQPCMIADPNSGI